MHIDYTLDMISSRAIASHQCAKVESGSPGENYAFEKNPVSGRP